MREILLYLLCRVARSFRGGDSIHGSRTDYWKAVNIKGTWNQTGYHSGLGETTQLVSYNRSFDHDVALDELPPFFLRT